MIQGKAKLTIDFGNSGTRLKVAFHQGQGVRPITRKLVLSNRFAPIDADYVPSSDYSSENSTIMVMGGDEKRGILEGSRFVNGELAEKEFYDGLDKPTALEKKYSSAFTVYSLQLAMLYAHRTLMPIVRATTLESLDITWDIVVLLPPGDLKVGASEIVQMIKGIKEMKYAYPDVTLPFKVNKVGVFAEGFCAYLGSVYTDEFAIRRGYEDIADDVTIVFDIGAGTTDILVIQDGKPVQKTLYTVEEGGNQVTARVRSKARERLGGKVSESVIAKAMETGYIKDGTQTLDITDIILEEKETFARNIVGEVKEFFEGTSFPIKTIGRALVVGGGAINNTVDGASDKAGSMADGVVRFMQKLSPNIQLVPLPVIDTIICDEDGEAVKESGVANPRDLNLLGGSILAEM